MPPPTRDDPGSDLVAQKVEQAADALDRQDVDCWLTFCRETTAVPDPALPLLLDFEVVWPTAVLVFPDGRSDVVLGRHDAPNARELGVHDVHPYDESIREPLLAVLGETDPGSIGLNYDVDDPMADGLSHGLYRRLQTVLDGTAYADRLTAGGGVVAAVRGQKAPAERERIGAAIDLTERLLEAVGSAWSPGWTERDVAEHLHGRLDEAGAATAWAREYCPAVHAGGEAPVGHTSPGDRTVPEGELLHLDFGARVEGYTADVQRVYVRGDPREELRETFADVRAAIAAGREALAPGVPGHAVDRAAREALVDRGHPEFPHALGHQVGRHAHDGGTLLGPRWERYGEVPEREVRAGEVYTLELGVETDRGYLGQEEMVLVREDGVEYLTDPQTDLWTV